MQMEAIHMKALLLLPLVLCSCSIGKFNQPPYGSAVTTHSRFFGVNVAYQGTGIQLGWGSTTWSVLPVSTNKIFAATVSDTFRLGQSANPFNTTITEDIVSGWEGQPPPARHLQLFAPVK